MSTTGGRSASAAPQSHLLAPAQRRSHICWQRRALFIRALMPSRTLLFRGRVMDSAVLVV